MRQLEKAAQDKSDALDAVGRALLKRAKGYTYKEPKCSKCKTVEYGENGKKVREYETLETVYVKKYMPPDLSAATLWLKMWQPMFWGRRKGRAAAIIDNVPPAPILTADEMAALAARGR